MPSAAVKARSTNLHQRLVDSDHRPFDLGHMEHICCPVFPLDDCAHPLSDRRRHLLGCRWHCHLVSSLLDRPDGAIARRQGGLPAHRPAYARVEAPDSRDTHREPWDSPNSTPSTTAWTPRRTDATADLYLARLRARAAP